MTGISLGEVCASPLVSLRHKPQEDDDDLLYNVHIKATHIHKSDAQSNLPHLYEQDILAHEYCDPKCVFIDVKLIYTISYVSLLMLSLYLYHFISFQMFLILTRYLFKYIFDKEIP